VATITVVPISTSLHKLTITTANSVQDTSQHNNKWQSSSTDMSCCKLMSRLRRTGHVHSAGRLLISFLLKQATLTGVKCIAFYTLSTRTSGYSIQVRLANVQAINVKFSQDLTYQKSLKSVNFWQSSWKNKKGAVFCGHSVDQCQK